MRIADCELGIARLRIAQVKRGRQDRGAAGNGFRGRRAWISIV